MQTTWNLNELYSSFDDPKIKEDQKKLEEVIQEYTDFSQDLEEYDNDQILKKYIDYQVRIREIASGIRSYAYLILAVDTANSQAAALSYEMSQYNVRLVEPDGLLEKAICRMNDLDEAIAKADLEEYSFILHEIYNSGRHSLSVEAQNIVASLNISGAEAWGKLKNQLIGAHTVEYKGERVPLTVVLNEAYSKCAEDRKTAYEAEIASYKPIETAVAACLSNIKMSASVVSKLKGYDSIIDSTLDQSRLTKETLEAMLKVMRAHRSDFERFLRRKAELLGHSNGLPWYDLYAPVVESKTEYPYEKACDIVVSQFAKFCKKESEFMDHAIHNGWIDVYPRSGKEGGAFCSGFGVLPQSRIMLNYGNSYSDVSTLAHELGHGFHSYCMKDEALLNKRYTMPIAETASTFNEIMLAKTMLKSVDDTDKIAILDSLISSDVQVLVDIYSRYLFEASIIEESSKKGTLSADRVKELMLDSQKEAYGSGLDPAYLHPYMWIWKPHYYYANLNFYNFPYAFGDLLARGLYAMYEKEGSSFADKYMEFLKNTGKHTIEDTVATIGITLNEEFFESSLKQIQEEINLFMELTDGH